MNLIKYSMGVSGLIYGLMAQGKPNESLTKDDKIVAITILAEARGEGQAGMYAVGAVIAQRAIERKRRHSVICLGYKQFSCWNGKTFEDLEHLLELPEAAYALLVAKNISNLDHSIVSNANHYHATWMKKKPYWAKGIKPVKTIGNHAFYKL
jgi:N-acetylmuramoyl-L-alanine amidase